MPPRAIRGPIAVATVEEAAGQGVARGGSVARLGVPILLHVDPPAHRWGKTPVWHMVRIRVAPAPLAAGFRRGVGEVASRRFSGRPWMVQEWGNELLDPSPTPIWHALVTEWLDWAEAGSELGVTPAKVRTMIRDHELAAAVPAPGAGPQVPAAFLQDGLVVKGLPGLLTVLHDGGLRRPGVHRLVVHRRRPARPPDRRAAGEPRRRGQAAGAGDGVLTIVNRREEMRSMSGLAALLAGRKEPGIFRWHGAFDVADVRHTVEHAGWHFGCVDGWHEETSDEFLAGVAEALDLPDAPRRASTRCPTACRTSAATASGTVLLWDGYSPFCRHDDQAFSVALSVLGPGSTPTAAARSRCCCAARARTCRACPASTDAVSTDEPD